MSSVSKKIRDTERVLRRIKDPDETFRLQLKLNEYKKQKENNAKNVKERVNSVKYHLVKFLERKKITRKVRSLERRISDYSSDEVFTLDELQNEVQIWMEKLTYVMYYPKDLKYIAILKEEATSSVEGKMGDTPAPKERESTWARARSARESDQRKGRKDRVKHAMEVEYNNAKDFAVTEMIEKDIDAAIMNKDDDNDVDNMVGEEEIDNEPVKVDKGYTPSPYDPVVYGGQPKHAKSVSPSRKIAQSSEYRSQDSTNKGKNNKSRKASSNDHRTRGASGSTKEARNNDSFPDLHTVKADSFFSEESTINCDDGSAPATRDIRLKPKTTNKKRWQKAPEIDTKGMSKQELRLHQWQQKTRSKHLITQPLSTSSLSDATSSSGGRFKAKMSALRSTKSSSSSSSTGVSSAAKSKPDIRRPSSAAPRVAAKAADGFDPNFNKSAWEMGKGISAQSASETVKRKNTGSIVNDKSVPKAKKIKFDD